MAGRLILEWTPIDAPAIEDPAIAATWASLSVRVVGKDSESCLTRVLDRHAKTVRNEVYGTLLPLAEWLARCWHGLFSARRAEPVPGEPRRVRSAWARTHRWRFCSEGTALPDLEFVPVGDDWFTCRWSRSDDGDSNEFERVLFLSDGEIKIHADELRSTLARFVADLIERLDAVVPGNPRAEDLRRTWSTAQNPADQDFERIRFCARIGVHWWTLTATERNELPALAANLRNPIADAGLEATGPDSLRAWGESCARVWQECQSAGTSNEAWRELVRSLRSTPGVPLHLREPWHRGWDAARLLREQRQRSHASVWDGAELETLVEPLVLPIDPSTSAMVEATIGWVAGRRPALVRDRIRARSSMRERFRRARDLYVLLFLGDPARDFGCVLSRRIAGALSVANAFATELLAPIECVRTAIANRASVADDEIGEIAESLDAPVYCVRHQIENHKCAVIVRS